MPTTLPCIDLDCECPGWQPPYAPNPSCRICGHPRTFHDPGYCCGTGCPADDHDFVDPTPTGDCHRCGHPQARHRATQPALKPRKATAHDLRPPPRARTAPATAWGLAGPIQGPPTTSTTQVG